jgi:hypothetical protein
MLYGDNHRFALHSSKGDESHVTIEGSIWVNSWNQGGHAFKPRAQVIGAN